MNHDASSALPGGRSQDRTISLHGQGCNIVKPRYGPDPCSLLKVIPRYPSITRHEVFAAWMICKSPHRRAAPLPRLDVRNRNLDFRAVILCPGRDPGPQDADLLLLGVELRVLGRHWRLVLALDQEHDA